MWTSQSCSATWLLGKHMLNHPIKSECLYSYTFTYENMTNTLTLDRSVWIILYRHHTNTGIQSPVLSSSYSYNHSVLCFFQHGKSIINCLLFGRKRILKNFSSKASGIQNMFHKYRRFEFSESILTGWGLF